MLYGIAYMCALLKISAHYYNHRKFYTPNLQLISLPPFLGWTISANLFLLCDLWSLKYIWILS